MAAARRGRVPPSRVLLVACFGAFLAFLDATIVNVAFPSIRESFPGTTIGELSWVLNAYNIVFAAFLIVCGRLTDLVGRRRAFVAGVALFTVASASCGARARRSSCSSLARVVQALRRGDARAGLARPGHRGLPRPSVAPHAIGAVGRVRRGRRRARAADRRRPGRAGRLALGVPRQPPVRPGRGLWAARQPAGREPGARPARACPTCVGAALLVGQPWRCSTSASSRAATGAGPARRCSARSSAPPCCAGAVRGQLAAAPLAAARPGAAAHPRRSTSALPQRWPRASASTPTCSPTSCGCSTSGATTCCGPVSPSCPARSSPRVVASRLGPAGRAVRLPRRSSCPGALVWAARLPLVPPAGRARARPSGPSGCRARCSAASASAPRCPLLGSATLAAVPGGRYATASAVVSSARQLGGVLGIAVLVVILGDPTPGHRRRVAARRAGCCRSSRSWSSRCSPLPLGRIRSAVDGRGGRRRAGRPWCSAPNPPAESGGARRRGRGRLDLSELPLFSALPDARPPPARAQRPGSSTCRPARC